MKNSIKCFAFDIDGTLIPRGHKGLSEPTIQAIHSLKNQGYEIVVATGRGPYFIQDTIKDILSPEVYVTCNGQLVVDDHFKPLVKRPLDPKETKTIIQKARQEGLGIASKCQENMKVYSQSEAFIPTYTKHDPSRTPILAHHDQDDLSDLAPSYGLFVMGPEESILASLEPLTKTLRLSFAYHRDGVTAYEIISKDVGKKTGLEALLEKQGLDWSEVCVFGDGDNDHDMIQAAGLGIAMGDAHPSALAGADYITKASDQDGVVHALQHFHFI